MTKAEKEKQIQALKNLGLTDEEVAKVLADDEKIDKGAKLFELPKELENAANNILYRNDNREKKVDTDKQKLIADLLSGIPYAETVNIINAEREVEFTYNGKKYKIVLSCPRK